MIIDYVEQKAERINKDNEKLKEWIDMLADFILKNHYNMIYENEQQWNERKAEIVRTICKVGGNSYENID